MDDDVLKKYAELLVYSGGNVQKGQPVVIACDVSNAGFARLVQDAAYDAGASEVFINWTDEVSTRTRYLRAADETFDAFPDWIVRRFEHFDGRKAVYLHIASEDPDLLAGVSPDRIKRFVKASRTATKPHSRLTMSNALRWSIVAVPSPKWAAKVFPGLPEDAAVEKLWGVLLKGARADGDDPRADWEIHRRNFEARVKFLNEKNFKTLRFKNGLGTDFSVGLANNHIWGGGGDLGQDGVYFFPNLPTEEIFTAPDRNAADGTVAASMPLSYQGSLIENFSVTFEGGRAVSHKAEKNEEVLKNIIEMDEGSRRLGEVALVPDSSPISRMGLLFYETLFDENASCHLALGKAYPHCIKGGDKLSEEELINAGVNDSLLHVDFMFGTSDMKIVGVGADGAETVIMENGEYVV
jgi:aminopeptidase